MRLLLSIVLINIPQMAWGQDWTPLFYDNKQGVYDSWSFMLSIGKHF